jgi:dTDP-4-dehydrorhamnose reductase
MIKGPFLVLGAGGQLGQEWVLHLTAQERIFYALTRDVLDVTDPQALEEAFLRFKPRVVVNATGYTQVDQAESEPEQAYALNAKVPEHLASLCASHMALLVHYSTDYVFGGTASDRNVFPDGFPENHPQHPQNVYGASKAAGEAHIMASEAEFLLIRVSWLCGRYGKNFVKTMLRLSETNDRLRVVYDQWGSPSFADNVVENTLCLIDHECRGVYHITSEGVIPWSLFAQKIMELSHRPTQVVAIPSKEYPTPAARPFFSKLKTDKLKQVQDSVVENWELGLARLLGQLIT